MQFSPRGTVKDVRQAQARFSAPMVPLGDPRPPIEPFLIDCAEDGSGLWIDSRTWVYDFARDLPGGLRCTFHLRPGLKTLSGAEVGGPAEFSFSTGGPAIVWSLPGEGSERVDEEQAFVLALDAEADPESIRRHVAFAVDGLPERIGVRVLEGEQRRAVLDAVPDGFDVEDRPVAVVQARRPFPNATRVRLVWGKGVRSRAGVANTRDRTLAFVTRPEFRAHVHCQRVNPGAECLPLGKIGLYFSAPVAWPAAAEITLVLPGGERRRPEAPEEPSDFVFGAEFAGPFPESAELSIAIPAVLRDDAGRELLNRDDFPLAVATDPFPPLAKFAARFGIVEWKAGAAIPVTVRNLEPEIAARRRRLTREPAGGWARLGDLFGRIGGRSARLPAEKPEEILPWLRRVASTRRDTPLLEGGAETGAALERFTLPKPGGAQAFEVIGIPFDAPGFYVVELASPRLGAALLEDGEKKAPAPSPPAMYVRAAVLVTNLSVHFKWGRENSLAWVTTLDGARPVGGAALTVHDCRGEIVARAETDRRGIARFGALPERRSLPNCYDSDRFDDFEAPDYEDYYAERALRSLDYGLLVVAQTRDDLSFVHTSWNEGIEGWRFQLPEEDWREPVVAHTIFDRPLFRAGETVHMKHVLRRQTVGGFAVLPADERPTLAVVRHLGSNDTWELPVAWDERGLAEGAWAIPPAAKLGRYAVSLKRPAPPATPGSVASGAVLAAEWSSGSFRVEEFRVPLMKASLALPAAAQVAPAEVPVDVVVQYLAGGGASHLPVVVRAQIRPYSFTAPLEHEHFAFANGAVREGIQAGGEEEPSGGGEAARPKVHQRRDLTLDAAGTGRAAITGLPQPSQVRELLVEAEFRDPNGEAQTVSATTPLWPAALLAGIKAEHWAGTKDALRARAAVLDPGGKPVAGAALRIDVFERLTYSHRKRLAGGFYGYEHVEEVRAVGPLCAGQTDARGELACAAAPPRDGNLVLQASVRDADGRTSFAQGDVWVAGVNEWGFSVDATDRMDLVPERRRYEPGDTARFQVRMPFRQATALVTTEREGVIDAWVEKLSGNEPVVEVPVVGAHAPNVFVSVLAVRGRVAGPPPTAMVDLAKPAFKLGVAEIRVGWQAHELEVRVDADRPVYQVRDKAQVKIAVRAANGKRPPAGAEVAVAAVDEGLLELEPNPSWNLLDSLMRRRGYRIQTSTAQTQVVGKRHYGRKALPPGGGGGRQATRELFDTLLLWRGRLPLDDDGEAILEVPLNDSLTAFRIVAVASAGDDLFGTGSTSIRSTQDLMVLSGLAPLVREGDRQQVEFTLRNTTAAPLRVDVRGRIEELPGAAHAETVDLAAGEARVVSWPVEVPAGFERLHYEVEAESGAARDRLRVAQRVRPAVPVRTFQSTITRWQEPLRQPVAIPADALPGRGGVEVRADATLAAGLDGVRAWMRDYPYTCLEQKVSRAVALGDEEAWRKIAAGLASYQDGDGLLKYFPGMTAGSEVLTAHVVALTSAAGWELPPAQHERVAEGLRRFADGSLVRPAALPTADLAIRKLAAVEALARLGRAAPELLESITVEPNQWPTSAVLDWWSILDRLPALPRRDARRAEAEEIVRARLDLRGTMLRFSNQDADRLPWLMVSPETTALRLVHLLLETERWREDLPRLARGALALQERGAWPTTVANAWGTLALERFAAVLEKEPVGGTTGAALAGARRSIDWSGAGERSMAFAWPAAPAELAIDHAGSGHPWLTITARAAIPLGEALASGLRVQKTVTPIEPRIAGRLSRGDRLHVRLEIESQSYVTWVVVDDPIPAGASHLGTGLARDSQMEAGPGDDSDEATLSPDFVERSFEAFRAYYAAVPEGRFTVDYVIRLNQSGRFHLPATRAEALYAPETFGELPNQALEVEP